MHLCSQCKHLGTSCYELLHAVSLLYLALMGTEHHDATLTSANYNVCPFVHPSTGTTCNGFSTPPNPLKLISDDSPFVFRVLLVFMDFKQSIKRLKVGQIIHFLREKKEHQRSQSMYTTSVLAITIILSQLVTTPQPNCGIMHVS